MDDWRRRRWAWKARKFGVSAFLVVHVGATVLWCLPPSPLRAATYPYTRQYLLPIGQWQYWGMFAPDPVANSYTLQADVVDAQGLRATHEFTKVGDYSWWAAIPRFRHSKYAVNMGPAHAEDHRLVACRHAVRKLGIPDSAFPVDVKLMWEVTLAPEPGQSPDPMTAKQQHVVGTAHFENAKEVWR